MQRLADRRGFEAISGAAAELLGGSIGVAELPIIAYMYTRTQDAPRSIFVTGMAVAFVVPQLVRIPPLIITDLCGPRDLILGGGAATILLFGLELGSRLHPYIPARVFHYLVQGVLLIIATKLADNALQQFYRESRCRAV